LKLLAKLMHKDVEPIQGRIFERKAARGIILDGSKILLLYTKRYNDYSFPGGGVDEHEDLITGLRRELAEETGAKEIKILSEFGYIDEYRPHYKPDYDSIHMLSYFYVCEVVGNHYEALQLEDYEISNGMSVVWIDIFEAIEHNKKVMESNESTMGLSIERETMALELVAKELVSS
jgi:ADP-ribose pyrophosphatase YjhB (NUDIX family)